MEPKNNKQALELSENIEVIDLEQDQQMDFEALAQCSSDVGGPIWS